MAELRPLNNFCKSVLKHRSLFSTGILQRSSKFEVRRLNYYSNATSSRGAESVDLSGIFPPIATPFNQDETIALDKLDFNLAKWNEIPFRGYTVLGSNGETQLLRHYEKLELIKEVVSRARDDHVIMVGCGCESTRDTIMMTEHAAQAGAHCALVLTPCFFRGTMTPTAFKQHYTRVADASPIPIVLYNVPGNTALDLDPNIVVDLARHSNIIGLKDSGGDITKLTRIVHETGDQDFQVLAGSAGFLVPSLAVGCVGGVCALANMLGKEVCRVYSLYQSGNFEQALQLQRILVSPNTTVTKTFGVPGLKHAMDLLGYYGGPTRSPLVPLTEDEGTKLNTVFTRVNEELTERQSNRQ